MKYLIGNPLKQGWLPKAWDLKGVNMNIMVNSVSTAIRKHWPRHEHSFYEMHYVLKGSMRIKVDDRHEVLLQENDFIVHAPYSHHQNLEFSPDLEKFAMSFSVNSMDHDLADALQVITNRTRYVWQGTEQMQLLVASMTQCSENFGDMNHRLILLLIEAFVVEALHQVLLNRGEERILSGTSRQERLVQEIKTFLMLNADRAIRNEEMIKKFRYSSRQLTRIIHKHCGCTVGELIAQYRIEFLQGILRNTDLSMAEIADKCSFNDATLMSKFFKSHTGMTPTEYRVKEKEKQLSQK